MPLAKERPPERVGCIIRREDFGSVARAQCLQALTKWDWHPLGLGSLSHFVRACYRLGSGAESAAFAGIHRSR